MFVEDRSMSYAPSIKQLMSELLHDDAEAWASLSGLMAILALPPIRERHRVVEVEITPGMWQLVHSIAIEANVIRFWFGTNGSRTEFTFLRTAFDRVPRWRVPQQYEQMAYAR